MMIAAPAFAQSTSMLAGWSGEASLSGSKTTGNTDTTDLGLGLNLAKESPKWRHKFYATADRGEVDDQKNKQRYTLGYQLDRDITDRLYVYGNGDYFLDDFGAYENGYFLGTGLGYKLVEPTPLGWDASQITYDFNEAVSLYNNSEVIHSKSDTYLWNEIGITANLMGNLAARASYRVDHHTDVLPGVTANAPACILAIRMTALACITWFMRLSIILSTKASLDMPTALR